MTKFAREFDFRWNAGEVLDDVFTDHRGMQSRSAAGENNSADIAQFRRRHLKATELRAAIITAQATATTIQIDPVARAQFFRVRVLN